jgi:hypothetical protein
MILRPPVSMVVVAFTLKVFPPQDPPSGANPSQVRKHINDHLNRVPATLEVMKTSGVIF